MTKSGNALRQPIDLIVGPVCAGREAALRRQAPDRIDDPGFKPGGKTPGCRAVGPRP